MKREITTLLMAISVMGGAYAQSRTTSTTASCSVKNTPCDRRLLSTTTEGDYTVSRYLVKERSDDNDEFSLKYRISLSRLISTYDNNANELQELRSFIEDLKRDTLRQITAVNVTGFASPDGSVAQNERLAMSRAVDFRQYINRNFDMSKYDGTTKADALTWADAYDATSTSSIPSKSEVLMLLKSSYPPYDIESKIKTMPQSWSYMRDYILPPMRSVELWVKYTSWKIVEVRTLVKSCTPEPQNGSNTYLFVVLQEPQNMVVNTSYSPIDYTKCRFKDSRRAFKEKYKSKPRRKVYVRRRR